MYRLKCHLFFRICILVIFLLVTCSVSTGSKGSDFLFDIIDVGQGLSQLGVIDSNSGILWDMGPPQAYDSWFREYSRLGKPFLVAIIISHRDLDHSGGLLFIDSEINWSGVLIASIYEDTSYIKKLCENWSGEVLIKTFKQGDSLSLTPELTVKCLWPPANIELSQSLSGEEINRYSLVFSVQHAVVRFLLTSDIDSIASEHIALTYKDMLNSQIVVLPHHGSINALDYLFAGYVRPELAIVSCARDNDYGHPSNSVLGVYSMLGSQIKTTFTEGSIRILSNGFLWQSD